MENEIKLEPRALGLDNHEVDTIFGLSAAPGPWASCVELLTLLILSSGVIVDVHTVLRRKKHSHLPPVGASTCVYVRGNAYLTALT